MKHFCKECGKAHAPRCDRCGATSDLRSYHGPCGKCAFGKAKMAAFEDEMRKIAAAGFMHNLGSRILTYAGRQTGSVSHWASKQPGNLWRAGAAHLHPLQGMKEGWKFSWDPKTGGGTLGRVMFLGGTGLSGLTAIPKRDPMGQGESRLTRGLRFAGGTATGLIAAKHGILPSLAYGIGGDVAGGYAGRAIDKYRGYKPPPPKQKLVTPPPPQKPFPAEQGT
jgi:hypothetical protein